MHLDPVTDFGRPHLPPQFFVALLRQLTSELAEGSLSHGCSEAKSEGKRNEQEINEKLMLEN